MQSGKNSFLTLLAFACLSLFALLNIPLPTKAAHLPSPTILPLTQTYTIISYATVASTASPQQTQSATPVFAPAPSSTPIVLDDKAPTDIQMLALLADHLVRDAPSLARNLAKDYKREDIDLNGDGLVEIILTGKSPDHQFGYTAIFGYLPMKEDSEKRTWQQIAFEHAAGHYCWDADSAVENNVVIASFLTCGGGTGILGEKMEQYWIKCGTTACKTVWQHNLLDWYTQWGSRQETQTSIVRIEHPNPETINIISEEYATRDISLHADVEEGVGAFDAKRIAGPVVHETYQWNGDVYSLVKHQQTVSGIEISKEFDASFASAYPFILEIMQKPFELKDNGWTSIDYPALDKAADIFWGVDPNKLDTDFPSEGWLAPQAATRDNQSGDYVAMLRAGKTKVHCRLNIQQLVGKSFQLVDRQDLPCVPNFSRVFWQDIDMDGKDELLFLTLSNDEADEAGVQLLRIFRVGNGLELLAQAKGTINGADGVGIRWQNDTNGFTLSTGVAPTNYDCRKLSCLSLTRTWKTYRWDPQTNTLDLQ